VKTLILLRHAKSSWESDARSDHDRPLAARGRRDAPRMGKRLKRRSIDIDLMLTSSATRAFQTTELVAAELSVDAVEIRRELYLASPGDMLALVQEQGAAIYTLMLVAHNPGMTEFANLLCPDLALPNLPTAGIVALQYDTDRWNDVGSEPAVLAFYDYPKNREPV
jgi:phosphohistidine phosphatase